MSQRDMILEFAKANGGPPIPMPTKANEAPVTLCPNGASIASGPAFRGPPQEPLHRLRAQRRYWQRRYEIAFADATQLQKAIQAGQVRPGTPCSECPWQSGNSWRWPIYGIAADDPAESVLQRIGAVSDEAEERLRAIDSQILELSGAAGMRAGSGALVPA